ncbi:hypothetical protein IQ215_07870 [Cyanobacterium stanieri LEGE 03274]|uniref:AbiJ-NTD3 domain-containing protein n=1 Tax=Cyanobacterium stanieri LEGE 03274 TaxID=1828756 RepID=A0ABR9V3Y3_9CHRO|nr:hypothetical protein [Cyanobacterium stanieri LEGE 03274]
MNKITEVTRRQIAKLFDKEFNYWGDDEENDDEIKFLERLYELEELPSNDGRFENAKDNNWIFKDEDDRFNLNNGNDDKYLLKFLCEILHPAIREPDNVQNLLTIYNNILSVDGYKIIEVDKLSNLPIFGFCEINNQIDSSNNILMKPIQKILFGSPGTGKSYQIRQIAQEQLDIQIDKITKTSPNIVKAVFHPEYSYADFMGKLLPFSQKSSVIYKFYPGHFLKILGKAYKSLIDGKDENYLLVIDELNRGNAAAIFGNTFQLLDRESDGWSSYEIDISEMELVGLFQAMNIKVDIDSNNKIEIQLSNIGKLNYDEALKNEIESFRDKKNHGGFLIYNLLRQCQIKLPPNLSIIGTINTSDESIYYLDTAFKRRWSWEFVNAPVGKFDDSTEFPEEIKNAQLFIDDKPQDLWLFYIVGINELIKSNHQTIRRIEDKLIGCWFIKPENEKVKLQQVKDKLMFYLWDNVFARDKRPLETFLGDKSDETNTLVTLALFSDFLKYTEKFLDKVLALGKEQYKGEFLKQEVEQVEDNLDMIPF